MKPRLAALAIVLALGGLTSATALGHRNGTSTTCTTSAGSVVTYLPTATHSCAANLTYGAPLFSAEFLATAPGGQLTFQTPYLFRCRELGSSSDVLAPTPTIALLHLWGTTWCRHRVRDPKAWLKLKNATVKTSGTIIGLTTDTNGSTVSIAQGTATVTTLSRPGSILVTQGTQLQIPNSGNPHKPTPLKLAPDDQTAVSELQLFVIEVGADQPSQLLQSRKETSAVVIGQDSATAKLEAAKLGDINKAVLTADQVRLRPQIVTEELTRLGAHTVITAGTFAALQPTWQLLRSTTGLLPAGTALIFVST